MEVGWQMFWCGTASKYVCGMLSVHIEVGFDVSRWSLAVSLPRSCTRVTITSNSLNNPTTELVGHFGVSATILAIWVTTITSNGEVSTVYYGETNRSNHCKKNKPYCIVFSGRCRNSSREVLFTVSHAKCVRKILKPRLLGVKPRPFSIVFRENWLALQYPISPSIGFQSKFLLRHAKVSHRSSFLSSLARDGGSI